MHTIWRTLWCINRVRSTQERSGSFRLLAQHHRFQSALETYSIERMAKNFILLDSFIQRRSPLLTVIQRMLVGGGLVVFSAPLIARIGAKTYISFLGFFYARYAAQQINSLRTLIVKEEEKKKMLKKDLLFFYWFRKLRSISLQFNSARNHSVKMLLMLINFVLNSPLNAFIFKCTSKKLEIAPIRHPDQKAIQRLTNSISRFA